MPMWKYFMARALRGTPSAPLARPPGLISARISPLTGQLAAAGDGDAIFEYLRASDLAALEQAPAPAAGSSEMLHATPGTDIF